MKLILEPTITDAQQTAISASLATDGCIINRITDADRQVIGITATRVKRNVEDYADLDGVETAVPISSAYKLVSREFKTQDTIVKAKEITVGGDRIAIIAGPCSVESLDQAMTIAKKVKKYGAILFQGGAYKPRSSPYSFQGLEKEGLKILAQVRAETGLGVVTEMTSPIQAELMEKYVDVVQIGARNMQNFELLKCAGKMSKPVLLKRGLAATIQEWLMSAEYIAAGGNTNIILCERGIRTFEPYTRNTLDLSAIPILKKLTHLPIVIDPSHATGIREKVAPMARAAVAAGADALMIEVHNNPDNGLSDGAESLSPEQFGNLTRDIYVIAPVVGKQLDFDYLKKKELIPAAHTQNAAACAITGEPGTYSHKACLSYFGNDVAPVAMMSFKEVFTAVKNNTASYGIVPVENSLSGSVHENYDLLQTHNLKIIGEITIRIKHALITHPKTDVSSIKTILAPAHAIAQCQNYLVQMTTTEILPVRTGVSAVNQAKELDPSVAAIGPALAAEIFDMTVAHESIEDNPMNYTRFAVIAREFTGHKKADKTFIIFSTGNRPGALLEVMQVFSDHHINLVKLESRPVAGKPWEYLFYAELEADLDDRGSNPVMDALAKRVETLKVLGRY
ncbi:3-deoxy-7-phosphoheptulonate synthase [uncultured Desulfobacter sp.]|uniref:3-deoxy-7-phosphoheptulonate synthase n=1 Tax=uncultured Desulfobacter sp. TaxID=240139 RepID=UPI0029F57C5F|nr:3-deoxy-7-phosphoheptulonate synthase [uncultured Desulfobacter sp.]